MNKIQWKWWKVYLHGKLIDKINDNTAKTADDVKRSLVNHDGYNPEIVVRRERKRA
jgi:hypothetical protein